jgi:hypothetical protein
MRSIATRLTGLPEDAHRCLRMPVNPGVLVVNWVMWHSSSRSMLQSVWLHQRI